MMDRNKKLLERIVEWGESKSFVRALVLAGSATYKEVNQYDQWSDLDMGFYVENPEKLAEDLSWLNELGEVGLVYFADNGTIQVFFKDHSALDLNINPAQISPELLDDAIIQSIIAKGYKTLLDKDNVFVWKEDDIEEMFPMPDFRLSEEEINKEIHEIAYHLVHAGPHVYRGDYFGAIHELGGSVTTSVYKLALDYTRRKYGEPMMSSFDMRNFHLWADDFLKEGIEDIFPLPNFESLTNSMEATVKVTKRLLKALAVLSGFSFDTSCLEFAEDDLAWFHTQSQNA